MSTTVSVCASQVVQELRLTQSFHAPAHSSSCPAAYTGSRVPDEADVAGDAAIEDEDVEMEDDRGDEDEESPGPFPFETAEEMSIRVEPLGAYQQGGLHPVLLGGYLGPDNRYRVAHKLGAGGFGAVWLCRDEVDGKWRAVKVLRASHSEESCAELVALQRFRDMGLSPDQLLQEHNIGAAIDYFWQEGPNGRHMCLVLPFLGPSLDYVSMHYGHHQELMKDLCFQVAEALAFLHSRGICHGDFRPSNILFQFMDGMDDWSEEQVVQVLGGEPETMFVLEYNRDDELISTALPQSIPGYLVEPGCVNYGSGACSAKIAVVDFGISYDATKPLGRRTGIPMEYGAPEDILGMAGQIGPAADVWSLAATLCKIRAGVLPFETLEENIDRYIENIEAVIGPLPKPYRVKLMELQQKGCSQEVEDFKFDVEDESKFARLAPGTEELFRPRIMKEEGVDNMLKYRIVTDKSAGKRAKAEKILLQEYKPGGPLPLYGAKMGGYIRKKDAYSYRIDQEEVEELFDLVMKMFRWNPAERLSAKEILTHPWFGGRYVQEVDSTADEVVDDGVDQPEQEVDSTADEVVNDGVDQPEGEWSFSVWATLLVWKRLYSLLRG